jgi:hypothetical protein
MATVTRRRPELRDSARRPAVALGMERVKGDFCDNVSITLEQVIIGKYALAPSISNEHFYLICISSVGNLHMKNMTPLPIVLLVLNF